MDPRRAQLGQPLTLRHGKPYSEGKLLVTSPAPGEGGFGQIPKNQIHTGTYIFKIFTPPYGLDLSNVAKNKITGQHTIEKSLVEIKKGKQDANFSVDNGKYKFFTCSNTPLTCDEFEFDNSSILIAGNGDFNVKHYTGEFNVYQRTYVLSPSDEYYALLYLSCLYRINSFRSSSTGSIVKFITKSDIDSIPVFVPDDENFLNKLNTLLKLIEKK